MRPGQWLEWSWLLPERPWFYCTRKPDRITLFMRHKPHLGLGLIRDGGAWIGNGGAGISLLCGTAHKHVATYHRKGRKWVGRRLGLYVGEDF